MSDEKRLLIGKIGSAHGIKGLVRVSFYGEDEGLLEECGPLFTSETGTKTIKLALKNHMKDVWLCEAEGVSDRNGAEALRNTELYIDEGYLPEIEDDNTFYYVDLQGTPVVDGEGKEVGTVRQVHNFGAGDLLEIDSVSGGSFYVPFTEEYVPEVDMEARRIVVQNYETMIADK